MNQLSRNHGKGLTLLESGYGFEAALPSTRKKVLVVSDFKFGTASPARSSPALDALVSEFLSCYRPRTDRTKLDHLFSKVAGQALHALDCNSECYYRVNDLSTPENSIIEFLERKGYLRRTTGKWRSDTSKSLASTFSATNLLADLLGHSAGQHVRYPEIRKKLIILRSNEGNEIEARLPPGLYQPLLDLNRFLRDIEIAAGPVTWKGIQYHRVFDIDWNHGGRFYCELSNQPKHLRQQMKIDGEDTIELDFTAMHICLAYAMAGRPPPKEDPYLAEGFAREEIKRAALVYLNGGTAKAVNKHWEDVAANAKTPLEAKAYLAYAARSKDSVRAFKSRHKGISSLWGTPDIGLTLQHQESQIIHLCLKRLLELRIAPICVHDSIRVQKQHADLVMQIMKERSHESCGYELAVERNL